VYKNNNIGMKTKIQKEKWCGMRKLIKNREMEQFSQSWYIRNTSSILLIQEKKPNSLSVNV
jgi:hypothetical protein